MADEKATDKPEAQKTAPAKAAPTPPAKAVAQNVEPQASHNVLTDDMPQPPGVQLRRRSRRKAAKRRQGPFAKYVGSSSLRVIRPHDWKTLGIELDEEQANETHSWSIKNDYMLETSMFTDEQLDYLFIDDTNRNDGTHEFLEVDYDDEGNLVQVPYEDDNSE
jgi:hypothetical protein